MVLRIEKIVPIMRIFFYSVHLLLRRALFWRQRKYRTSNSKQKTKTRSLIFLWQKWAT